MSEVQNTIAHAAVVPIEGTIYVPENMVRDPSSILPDEVVECTAERYGLARMRGIDPMAGVGTIPRVLQQLGSMCNAGEIDPEQQRVATAETKWPVALEDCRNHFIEERYSYIYTSVPFGWFRPGTEPPEWLARKFDLMLKPGGILLIDSDDFTTRGGTTWPLAARQIEYFERHGFRFDESVRYVATKQTAGDAAFTELKFTKPQVPRPEMAARMLGEVLVTGELFISPDDERRLRSAGLEPVRLPQPAPTEDELIEALPGKVGYLLGGEERVTERALQVADRLRAIVFCGSDYAYFIPAWEYAYTRGIDIGSVPAGHAKAVAEWCQAVALAMNRGFFGGGGTTAPGLVDKQVGIIGLGHIGRGLASMIKQNHSRQTLYSSRRRYPEYERWFGLQHESMDTLVRTADAVFLCVSGNAGAGFYGAEQLEAMKPGALLVSCMVPGVVDEAALLRSLQKPDGIRAVSDYPMQAAGFNDLPPGRWWSGTGDAFNTEAGVRKTGDAAVDRLIQLIRPGLAAVAGQKR